MLRCPKYGLSSLPEKAHFLMLILLMARLIREIY
jgi:hypothetical protein